MDRSAGVRASASRWEDFRLVSLRLSALLDTPPEEVFDVAAAMAARICRTPMAAVSLVDSERVWFKARIGILWDQLPRSVAFCPHAISGADLFVVQDARLDPRFAANPLVTGSGSLRFYAAMPVVTRNGAALGTLCVLDTRPRRLTGMQLTSLRQLGRLLGEHVVGRRAPLLGRLVEDVRGGSVPARVRAGARRREACLVA